MVRDTLRHPPPSHAPPRPPPPVFNRESTVDSWLESLPTNSTKPSPEELRQWSLNNRGGSRRAWLCNSIFLRGVSLVLALTITIYALYLFMGAQYSYHNNGRLTAALVVAPIAVAWDSIEFISIFTRLGEGISPQIHVWVDGVLCLGMVCAIILLLTDVILGDVIFSWNIHYDYSENLNKAIGLVAVLFIFLILHSSLVLQYMCRNRIKRGKKRTTPRIMYLPTGEAVVVTNRPVDLGLKVQQQPADVPRRLQRTAPNPNVRLMLNSFQPPPPRISTQSAPCPGAAASQPTLAISPTVARAPITAPMLSPAAQSTIPVPVHVAQGDEFDEPFRQGVPPRKPVAGAKVGTHYAAPWPGPDHRPNEAERARAARGEAQAQWVSLHGMHLGGQGGSSMKGDGTVGRESLTIQDNR
ncbi:hypothetical protein B0T19DRAFT_424872 [Cercophora scortea]|uniref:Uncharacterized protein n=1 Tax=Cercophora scortea TaxID=314031 RepID=A0AAE0INY7_9PEZI|nr:hypothetical protein B0T19DRAFT_424872 [Cercophora scortea]